MRILMLTPQPPYPPRQGTALRNWGLLRGLAAQHELSLLTFAPPGTPRDPHPRLRELVRRIAVFPQPTRTIRQRLHSLATSTRPDLTFRLASTAFRRQLRHWLDEFPYDWLVVEGLELAPYASELSGHNTHLLFDDHNCEYLLQKRAALSDLRIPRRWPSAAYSLIQWQRLKRYEAAICRRAEIVIAVSEADARALRRIAPQVTPLIVPNGIHLADFPPLGETADLRQPAFVFTGTLDFRPNVDGVSWFIRHVWPDIHAALPQAHCYIVGRRPHPRLLALQDRPGIVFTGGVPDTKPYIRAATVFIVPLLVGGGTRLKILESTALGKTDVSTTLGAEGFHDPAQALTLADTPADFAAACIRLAEDQAARDAIASRARAFAAAYDWAKLLPPLLDRLSAPA